MHLVLDNYATHKHPKVRAWLAARPRYHAFVAHYNAIARPFAWTATADSILAKLERLLTAISRTRQPAG